MLHLKTLLLSSFEGKRFTTSCSFLKRKYSLHVTPTVYLNVYIFHATFTYTFTVMLHKAVHGLLEIRHVRDPASF